MTRKELDTLWQQALHESVVAGEDFIRYHFAALVAAVEREACAKVCEQMDTYGDPVQCWLDQCAAAIRTRGTP